MILIFNMKINSKGQMIHLLSIEGILTTSPPCYAQIAKTAPSYELNYWHLEARVLLVSIVTFSSVLRFCGYHSAEQHQFHELGKNC
jgi:hypothetical protein